MKIQFSFRTFIFLLLSIFIFFSLISINSYIYFFTYVFVKKEKLNEYESILEAFDHYFNRTMQYNENFIHKAIDLLTSIYSPEEKRMHMERLIELYPMVKYFIIFDKDGFIKEIYPFREDLINLYLGNTSMFKEIGKTLLYGPHIFVIDRKSYYVQSVGFSENFAVILIDIPDFNLYLRELYKKGYISFIIDSSGRIVAHYDESIVEQGTNIRMLSSDFTEIRETKEPKEFNIMDEKYLLYSKYLPFINNYVYIGNHYDRAFAGYTLFREQIFWFAIFFIALSLLISLLISDFLEKPIQKLFKIIDNIKKHKYDVTIEKMPFYEFNILAKSLADMGKAISEREYKLSKIFEVSRDAIIVSTLDGNILDINPAGIRMFGFEDKSKIKDKNAREFYYNPEDREKLIRKILEKGYVENFELKAKKANGSYFYALLNASLVRDEKGNPYFLFSTINDITEKIKMQEQLFQSQKMESLGKLVGTIAHDLNNILTVISSNNQLIQIYTKENEKIKKYNEGIAKAIDKIKDFIKQLLSFSKRQVFEFKNYDINEVIQEEAKLLKPTIREDINLEIKTYPETIYVNFDRTQFTQILLNLMVNSMEAMPEGGNITISIDTKRIDRELAKTYPNIKEGNFVCISFSDTGKGIPDEIKNKIFDPFFTTKERGTGLGLSTVHSIVEQHKGFINVYSEVGKGTTFRIYLPITESEKDVIENAKNEIIIEQKRIILVEDNPEVRAATEELLKKYNFEVYSFSSGKELLENFDSYIDKFDICLSDIIMPRMNGLELYRKLKEIKPDVKFLFMTGYADNIEQLNELVKEGLKVLSKPFTIEEFMQKVKEIDS